MTSTVFDRPFFKYKIQKLLKLRSEYFLSNKDEMKGYRRSSILILLLCSLLLAFSTTCNGEAIATEAEQELEAEASAEENEEEEAGVAEEVAEPEVAGVPGLEPLPPRPQKVEFKASDGHQHTGRYFPAAVNPVPVIVLMHWAPGDQDDWVEIAYWLQNRGLGGKSEGGDPWLDPTWFPLLEEEESYAVFTFTFRGCDGGCKDFLPDGWALDAKAAMDVASQLEGVDPHQIVVIGASIGADGAVDGCSLHNTQATTCVGALSLSPGNYLDMRFDEMVNNLGKEDPPKPVWCITSERESEICEEIIEENYKVFIYDEPYHGMELIQPELTEPTMMLIYKFIHFAIGVK